MNKVIDALSGLKELETGSVDLVFTSPPYADMKGYDDDIPPDKYVEWFLPIGEEIARVLKPDGSFVLNINDKVDNGFRSLYVFELVIELVKKTDLKLYERLFWNKMKGLPAKSRFGDRVEYLFWFSKNRPKMDIDKLRVPHSEGTLKRMKRPVQYRYARDEVNQEKVEKLKHWSPNPLGSLPTTLVSISSEFRRKSNHHFSVFPEKLAEYFISGITVEGDLVVDPFVGSGTTAYVARKLGRKYIGFDINELAVKDANERCATM